MHAERRVVVVDTVLYPSLSLECLVYAKHDGSSVYSVDNSVLHQLAPWSNNMTFGLQPVVYEILYSFINCFSTPSVKPELNYKFKNQILSRLLESPCLLLNQEAFHFHLPISIFGSVLCCPA